MLNVYLAGEIHSNWREEIIQLCQKEKLDIQFSSPVTNHENSDNCGIETVSYTHLVGSEMCIRDRIIVV